MTATVVTACEGTGQVQVHTRVTIASSCGVDPPERLSRDRLCELSVADEVRQVVDAWDRRFGVTVWCLSEPGYRNAPADSVPTVTVTVALANGEDALTSAAAAAAEETLRGIVDGAVSRLDWGDQYVRRSVQVIR